MTSAWGFFFHVLKGSFIKNIISPSQILDVFDSRRLVRALSKPHTSIPRTSPISRVNLCMASSCWRHRRLIFSRGSSASEETSAMCTVALYSPLRDFSTIWQGPHETSRGLWKIWSFHCLQSTHCATLWILPLSSLITLYTIFGCRWLWDHLIRTYMVTYSILFIHSRLAVTIVGFISGLLEDAEEAILWISITNKERAEMAC